MASRSRYSNFIMDALPRNDFVYDPGPNPHWVRMKQILEKHPEIKNLYGNTPSTAVYATFLVILQIATASYIGHSPWWLLLILSYVLGATINHALFVVIHECTHSLVFKKPAANRIFAIFCNLPQFFPSAMAFFKYHMLHHTHQSQYDFDADLSGHREAQWIYNSPWKKAASLFFFSLVQGAVRPNRLKQVRLWDLWFVINVLVQFSFLILIYHFFGWGVLIYLFFSTLFALGLHPLGGRWIQEHYIVKEGQETNSYYGPLNKLCFNMGYHNEHHDFVKVSWSRLPKVRSLAPEFYDHLFYYRSWTACLYRFIFNSKTTFYDRIVREKSNNS